eukprot:gene22951-22955_t
MDGALKPNTALDDAEVVTAALAPDNLAVRNGVALYSSHREIREIGGSHRLLESCPSDITAIAVAKNGTLAIGLEDGTLKLDGRLIEGFNCITALCFHEGSLFVTNGSEHVRPGQWVSDLMHRNASGTLWQVDVASGERRKLAGGLAFANGVAVDAAQNRLIVSESWKH